MKYIFCIIAVLLQPVFSWYVCHRQDKRQAALKMPMLYYSAVYLVVQLGVFFRFCTKLQGDMQKYSYLIQAVILLVFVLLELALFGSNQYIQGVQEKEQASIWDFKALLRELETCRVNVTNPENQQQIDRLLEKMRYADPVSSPAVQQENDRIHELIVELSAITGQEMFAKKCEEISKQLDIRKIKNVKEQG
jgi:hypothetical protein